MSNKRKASEAQLDTNPIDISSMDETSLSKHLLSMLPDDATKGHEQVNKLQNAYRMAMEVDNRTNEEERQIVFGNTAVLPDAFRHILTFLNAMELMHKVSYVCKAWSSEARHPSFWTRLDSTTGLPLFNRRNSVPMWKLFTEVFMRPQFRNLKTLILPENIARDIHYEHAMIKLAEHCPKLEELGLGFLVGRCYPWSEDLEEIATRLTCLKKVELNTKCSRSAGVVTMANIMGDRLTSLRVHCLSYHLRDAALESIAGSCPNLERFEIYCGTANCSTSESNRNGMTERGIIQLIRRCSRLKYLWIGNMKRVGLAAFELIAQGESSLTELHVTGVPSLFGSKEAVHVRALLSEQVENLTIIAGIIFRPSMEGPRTGLARRGVRRSSGPSRYT